MRSPLRENGILQDTAILDTDVYCPQVSAFPTQSPHPSSPDPDHHPSSPALSTIRHPRLRPGIHGAGVSVFTVPTGIGRERRRPQVPKTLPSTRPVTPIGGLAASVGTLLARFGQAGSGDSRVLPEPVGQTLLPLYIPASGRLSDRQWRPV